MPAPTPSLNRAHADRIVREFEFGGVDHPAADACDRNGVGIELEFLTDLADPQDREGPTSTPDDEGSQREAPHRLPLAVAERLRDQLTSLPSQSRLTIEPGGQLELSTRPFPTLDEACAAAAADLLALDQSCARRGIGLFALGQDPVRDPARVVTAPRYRAMEAYFDAISPAGRMMMTNTASIQLNVGLGEDPDEAARRWELANAIGPAMTATFANSPFAEGGPSGWQSTRLRTWWQLDPSRTAPVAVHSGDDPAAAWLDYAMGARVMLIRTTAEDYLPVLEPLTFNEWLTAGHETGYPTEADWRYHLTTLFPPVRPRGWFEIRYLDALPTPFWHVATAVVVALCTHPELDGVTREAVAGTEDLWVDASQLGLGHPDLARAATDCFDIATAALPELGVGEATQEVVSIFEQRWIGESKSPGDDARERWIRDGTLFPPRESPVPYASMLAAEAQRR